MDGERMSTRKNCSTGSARSLNQGAISIEFQTVSLTGASDVINTDVLVKFNSPHRFFMVASVTQVNAASMLALSFSPVGYQNTGASNTINPTGGENWIPLSNPQNSAGRPEGRWIKFSEPVQQFYITSDHPSGIIAGGYKITFLGTDDIEMVISERT